MHNPQYKTEVVTWVCTYTKNGKALDVNLRGTSEEAVLVNNLQAYPGLKVLGKWGGSYDAPEFD